MRSSNDICFIMIIIDKTYMFKYLICLNNKLMNERILTELRDHLLNRISFDNLPENVWKRTGALNTWGTNAVEGNTLTWHDVEQLLIEQRSIADGLFPMCLRLFNTRRLFEDLSQDGWRR